MNNQTAYLIAEREPEFPCWMWTNVRTGVYRWIRYGGNGLFEAEFFHQLPEFSQKAATHWLPDSPETPTLAPDAPKEGKTLGGDEPMDEKQPIKPRELTGAAIPSNPASLAPQEGTPTTDDTVILGEPDKLPPDSWVFDRQKIARLERDNASLRAAQKACEDCMTPTYAQIPSLPPAARDALDAAVKHLLSEAVLHTMYPQTVANTIEAAIAPLLSTPNPANAPQDTTAKGEDLRSF